MIMYDVLYMYIHYRIIMYSGIVFHIKTILKTLASLIDKCMYDVHVYTPYNY